MTSFLGSFALPDYIFEKPAVSILVPIVLGTGVGFSMQPSETQQSYLALKQPPYRPPPQVFGPVWTVLYGCMGYAAYRAWSTGMASGNQATIDLTKEGAALYTVQLGLNLIWMPLFFKFKRPIEATVDIVALTGTTAYLSYVWGQVDEVASWFLAPYLGWLGFATYLCAGAGYLNDWNFDDKLSGVPPGNKRIDTKFVDERDLP